MSLCAFYFWDEKDLKLKTKQRITILSFGIAFFINGAHTNKRF